MRAEFSAAIKRLIAERAGYQCSVLNCGRLTIGPGTGPRQTVRIGIAAHIYAASPDGPRGTGGLSAAQRGEPENGIWCCSVHGKAIDSDNGHIYSATQLKAWKRLHEARKSAEINGGALHHIGLVESISVNSAPAPALEGRKFDLGMRNIIAGPNGSGKSILTRLIASVAYPDHVANMSQQRNVDMAVRWFDPNTHDVATRGRAGAVSHVLDGIAVPYVARPYKTILLECTPSRSIGSIVSLAQKFDLNISAMKATLDLLASKSDLVRQVRYEKEQLHWDIEINGHRLESKGCDHLSSGLQARILVELAGVHAQHHARVEPTFLLLDGFMDLYDSEVWTVAMDRLQQAAEHAQVAVVSHPGRLAGSALPDWTMTLLEHRPYGENESPIDFEIETKIAP